MEKLSVMFQFEKRDFVSCFFASPDFDEVESLDQLSPLPWREKEGVGLLNVQQIAKKEQQVLSIDDPCPCPACRCWNE